MNNKLIKPNSMNNDTRYMNEVLYRQKTGSKPLQTLGFRAFAFYIRIANLVLLIRQSN